MLMPNEGCVAADVVGISYQAAPLRFGDVHMRAWRFLAAISLESGSAPVPVPLCG